MINENQITEYHNHNLANVFVGLLIGGLAGASAMLLLAPQSGAKTREQIQEKSIELRDETTSEVEAAMAQAWLAKNKLTRDGRRKANELIHRGKTLVDQQVERVTETAKTWKKSYLSA